MRFLLHKAAQAGLIAALLLAATPVWAGALRSALPDSRPAPMAAPAPLSFLKDDFTNHGRASWYGTSAQGRRTASGRVYDRDDFTAAHPSLPFGTVVRVHNMANRQQVLVTITDRGPFSRARVLDLSLRAAKSLRMIKSGVVPVVMEVVADPDGRPLNGKNSFYLRLERVHNASEAHRASAALKQRLQRDIRVLQHEDSALKEFSLCIGPFADFASAEEAVNAVDPKAGVHDIIEGPTIGFSLPLRAAPPKMAVDANGRERKILSEK